MQHDFFPHLLEVAQEDRDSNQASTKITASLSHLWEFYYCSC